MLLRPDFVVSDSHWFHKNIVKYQDRPYDHDWIMLKRWAATVKDTQTVLHLGDLFFSRKQGLARFTDEIAPMLTGQKYLILGNHDRHDLDYAKFGFTVLEPYEIEYDGFTVSFDHYPKVFADPKRLHVHGHIHKNPYSEAEPARRNNINVSVEVIDYRPQRLTKLLNAAILSRKEKEPFYNSGSYRQAKTDKQRRVA